MLFGFDRYLWHWWHSTTKIGCEDIVTIYLKKRGGGEPVWWYSYHQFQVALLNASLSLPCGNFKERKISAKVQSCILVIDAGRYALASRI